MQINIKTTKIGNYALILKVFEIILKGQLKGMNTIFNLPKFLATLAEINIFSANMLNNICKSLISKQINDFLILNNDNLILFYGQNKNE